MATHVLPSDTLISTLSLTSGDTIDLNGHSLIVDADAVATPVTLTNAGGIDCYLELRDLSRIKLNATLPDTIHPYVDPEHPLPVAAEPGIDGDPYRTPLTANARSEIQLATAFPLGGGAASLPTATRDGAFWARVAASPSTTSLVFDRDLPLHVGDIIQNLSLQSDIQRLVVAGYDAVTRTATLSGTLNRRSVGDVWAIGAGGVVVSSSGGTVFTAPVSGGTLVVVAPWTTVGNTLASVFAASAISAARASFVARGYTFTNPNQNVFLSASYPVGCQICQLAAPNLVATGSNASLVADELAVCTICYGNAPLSCNAVVSAQKGCVVQPSVNTFAGAGRLTLGAALLVNTISLSSGTISYETGGTTVQAKGTVTRTARTDFPTDTDLPDAQYHAPNAAGAVTWRYEDRWVRRGETLRLRARWMPAGAASRASVAVTELATWCPDLWPIGAEALAKAEFAAGLEQLKWHDGAVEWRNDTGEDCQIRVWECVSGDTLGGYLRVWAATGGVL